MKKLIIFITLFNITLFCNDLKFRFQNQNWGMVLPEMNNVEPFTNITLNSNWYGFEKYEGSLFNSHVTVLYYVEYSERGLCKVFYEFPNSTLINFSNAFSYFISTYQTTNFNKTTIPKKGIRYEWNYRNSILHLNKPNWKTNYFSIWLFEKDYYNYFKNK